jgi:hypothetical protein
VLKSRGTRQRYHGFLPFIPSKIFSFKVQSSFVGLNCCDFEVEKTQKYFVYFKFTQQERMQIYPKNQILPNHNSLTVPFLLFF